MLDAMTALFGYRGDVLVSAEATEGTDVMTNVCSSVASTDGPHPDGEAPP